MMTVFRKDFIVVPLLLRAISVTAQSIPPITFFWGFNSTSTLTQCQTVDVFVESLTGGDASGDTTPPYTMNAFSPSMVPFSSNLGSNPGSLSWTVNVPAGTKTLLTVMDAMGLQGGVGDVFTIKASDDDSCLQSNTNAAVSVKVNATTIETCDPLQIDMSGGKPPYIVNIVVADQAIVSESLSSGDNRYTWANVANPNETVLVYVQDSTGATSLISDFITTTGSNDTVCPGASSFASNSNNPSITHAASSHGGAAGPTQTGAANGAISSRKSHTSLVVGLAVGLSILFLILLIIFFLCCSKRYKKEMQHEYLSDYDEHSVASPTMMRAKSPSDTDTITSAAGREADARFATKMKNRQRETRRSFANSFMTGSKRGSQQPSRGVPRIFESPPSPPPALPHSPRGGHNQHQSMSSPSVYSQQDLNTPMTDRHFSHHTSFSQALSPNTPHGNPNHMSYATTNPDIDYERYRKDSGATERP